MSKITRISDTTQPASLTSPDTPETTQEAKLPQNAIDAIEQGSAERQPWDVENGLPVKWRGPELNGSGNDVAIESLEISHEGLMPTELSPPGRIEYPNISFYIPEEDETLQSIALKFAIPEEALAEANNLNPADPLPERIRLKIPGWK